MAIKAQMKDKVKSLNAFAARPHPTTEKSPAPIARRLINRPTSELRVANSQPALAANQSTGDTRNQASKPTSRPPQITAAPQTRN